jgi:DNA-binding transcriptional LysR family regulator
MLNVARLRVLREAARAGSISGAAETLMYTQSAVSQQIATLEAETGTTLLERLPRGVRPTAAGAALVEHADEILARLQSAEDELAAIAGLRGGRLRMASFPTAGAALMPVAIANFRAAYPEVELTLAEGEPEEIAPRLLAGELDLALLFEFEDPDAPSAQDLHDERLKRVPLLLDPMYLALPAAHPLAERPTLRLEALSGEAWVQTSQASPCARHVVRCCHAAGFQPNVAFESDDYQTVLGLVAAGVGVALIPELALAPGPTRADVVVRTLAPAPPVRDVIAALPGGTGPRSRLIPAASAMLRILEGAAAARHRPLESEQAMAPARRHRPLESERPAASAAAAS